MDDSWAELRRPITAFNDISKRDKPPPTRSASKQQQVVNTTRAAKVTVVEAVKQGKIDLKSRLATSGIAARRLEMAMNQKTKRAETQFANRGIDVRQLKSSSGSDPSSIMSSSITSSGSNMTNGSTVVASSEASTTSEARRKQLNKWKQEKNAMQNIADKKPTFKPGGVSSLNNKPQQLPPPPLIRQKNSSEEKKVVQKPPAPVRAAQLPPAKKPLTKSNDGGVQTQLPERRVTRAMAKGMEVEPKGKAATKIVANNSSKSKTILPQMKTLTINGNNRAAVKAAPSSKTVIGPPATTKNKLPATNNRTKTTIMPNAPVENTKPLSVIANDNEPVKMDVDPPEPKIILDQEKEVSKKETVAKKHKPQAIDAVYTEYNLKFSQALQQLSNYYEQWQKINDNDSIEIPTEIRDDIISTLGKVRLLLSSKLPQFVELLYSYLCKGVTPSILECDLQGWWDVAYIQVSLVFSEFEKLSELESNKWVRQEIVKKKPPPPTLNGMKGITKVQGTVSKGMKEFLAMKRKVKVAQNDSESPITTSGETAMDSSSSGTSNDEKKFEGGFFVIQSPARSTTTTGTDSRRASLRRNENSPIVPSTRPTHTPGGRRLSTSLSLRSLTLRNSMGPLYKGDSFTNAPYSAPGVGRSQKTLSKLNCLYSMITKEVRAWCRSRRRYSFAYQ
ncbi:hepatoma-derived growth factor-related protein 2 isoform X2 [Folsomia candida]|uniref:hepatoma-derived growth factor-related protein 2 isoform X2 n=1 Tax=Folsomia candida TaxID=158441 RepID=UPI00160540C0|nr:hepatoma-derived growth factor-related protein 2 isoform X2 [Folsomia candida]